MTKEELVDYLVEEVEIDRQTAEEMSPRELIDSYLVYEGIVGYTREILRLVEAAYGIQFNEIGGVK